MVDTTDVTRPKTRWDELQETLSDLVSMLLLVDHNDGFALRLLNDPQVASNPAAQRCMQRRPQRS